MKWLLIFALGLGLLSGCCTCKKLRKPDTNPNATNSPTTNDIDGIQNYRAQDAGNGVFVVTLPHGTDATKISAINIWVNTKGLIGRRKGSNITCDTIAVVSDPPAHTTIEVNEMFKSLLNKDSVFETDGYATSNGDVFDFYDGTEQFNQVRATVSRGQVWIRLKNNQPEQRIPVVHSAKVKITLR